MNLTNSEKQALESSAILVVSLIKNSPDFLKCDVLRSYVEQYLDFIYAVRENRILESKYCFKKISSLSRAYLEIDSDWKKPFLIKMYNFEKLGKSIYF